MSNMNEKELYKLAEIRVSNVDKKIYPDKALVKLCNYMDVYNNDYIDSKLAYSIGSADANELLRFGLKKNDVIITKDSETPDDIAISSIVTEDIVNLVCGYHLAIIRPNSDELDGLFLMFKLKDNEIVRYFSNAAKGSTRFGLSIADIENVKLKYPSVPEQRRIAHILSTCDAVIEKTQSAISKYKAIKQGMLHDLFTRGIDLNTYKLRPRYEDAPELYKESKLGWIPREWGDDILGNLVLSYSGGTPSRGIDRYYKGDIPWVTSSEVNQDEILKTNQHITQEALDNSSAKWVEANTVLVAMYGATAGQISMLRIRATTNQAVLACPSIGEISTDFLYYLLVFNKENLLNKTQGTGQPNLSKSIIDTLEVIVPKPNEQEKIAEKLKTIDNKLKTEQTYLQKMQQLKKGLMEDLLSGKKRVNTI